MDSETRIEDVIYFLMDRTVRQARQYTHRVFAQEGIDITIDQSVLMRIVSEQPGISQGEIAALSNKDAPTVTRILDLLMRKGYLERQAHPADRRKYAIYLTEAGQKLHLEIDPVIQQIRATGIAGIAPEDLVAALKVIEAVNQNFQ